MLLVLATAALMSVPSAEEQPEQWLCSYSAAGARGSSIAVQFYVQADGALVGQGVLWTPPMQAKTVSNRALSALDLSIAYDEASKKRLGDPTGLTAGVFNETNLDVLDEATADFILAGGLTSAAPFETFVDPNYRLATFAPGDLKGASVVSGLENGNEVKLVVVSAKGEQLVSIVYDLSGRGERDRLFRKAWRKATAKLARPTECDKTSATVTVSAPVP